MKKWILYIICSVAICIAVLVVAQNLIPQKSTNPSSSTRLSKLQTSNKIVENEERNNLSVSRQKFFEIENMDAAQVEATLREYIKTATDEDEYIKALMKRFAMLDPVKAINFALEIPDGLYIYEWLQKDNVLAMMDRDKAGLKNWLLNCSGDKSEMLNHYKDVIYYGFFLKDQEQLIEINYDRNQRYNEHFMASYTMSVANKIKKSVPDGTAYITAKLNDEKYHRTVYSIICGLTLDSYKQDQNLMNQLEQCEAWASQLDNIPLKKEVVKGFIWGIGEHDPARSKKWKDILDQINVKKAP